jgi:tRNA(Arg) A34 adenosine deaminase TadA
MQNVFMRRAVELARLRMHDSGGGPFGAVIVRHEKIISEGWNQVTSTNDPTAHAEVVAIRRACAALDNFALADCDIYTSCEPCPMCLGAIYWARLGSVFYSSTRTDAKRIGFDDEFIYEELALPSDARRIPLVRIVDDDADVVFREWAAKPDKKLY